MTATPRAALSGISRGALVALGASIPISVAADNVLLGAIVLAWLASGRVTSSWKDAAREPVVLFAWVWIAVHALGGLYSIGETHDVVRSIGKAAIFVLVPASVAMLDRPRDRELALYAFMAAIALTLALSCLRGAGLIPPDAPLLKPVIFSPTVVFKYHLTQNLLMAFGAFAFAVQATRVRTRGARIALAAAAAGAALNVLFLGDGRTGQVVLIVLIVYFGAWRAGWKGACAAAVVGAALFAAAYATPHSALHRRADLAVSEAREWEAQSGAPSSTGQRLAFYTHSLQIIARHPLIGVGTGGFPEAYERHVRGTGTEPTRNPHNEYLLKGVEFGVLGIVLLAALLWLVWRRARVLEDPAHRGLARALVLTFAAASLTASTLSDHTEGLLFVWLVGVLFSSRGSAAERRGDAP